MFIHSMPDYYKLRIKEIADSSKDYRFWKVHWIGRTSINKATNEMVIDVCLVPLLKPESFTDGSRAPEERVYNRNYAFRQRQTVKIGVGQLPLIRIGAVYKDGYPYERPKYITGEFKLTVTEENQKIISLGNFWGDWVKSGEVGKTRYYIPAPQYQVFFAVTSPEANLDTHSVTGDKRPYKSKCLVVDFSPEERPSVSLSRYPLNLQEWKEERGDNVGNEHITADQETEVCGLIIPCIEMVRFYYTKSSQLCREMLFGGLDKNRIFVAEKTIQPTPERPDGFLMLSKYVRNRDAPMIARYAFDQYAMSQARNIYVSSLNNLRNEKAALPEAKFPFRNQSTDMVVHGTYLQSGSRVYFLVFYIESCSAKFPFADVEFWRTNPGNANAPETKRDITQSATVPVADEQGTITEGNSDGGQNAAGGSIRTVRNTDTIEAQSQDIPSAIRRNIDLLLKEDERFLDLRNHEIVPRKPKSEDETERPVNEIRPSIISDGDDGAETAGTAVRSGTNPVTSFTVTPADILPDDPDEMDDVVEDNIYDKNAESPDLSPFIFDEDVEIEEEFDNDFGDDFPVPRRTSNGKSLPIDIDVFRGILGWIGKLEPKWQVRMIEVPASGSSFKTKTASPFPSNWNKPAKRPSFLPSELFIAEIKGINSHYAYLLDIEATFSDSGNSSRSFLMFLCLEKPSNKRLLAGTLRYVLRQYEKEEGIWLPPTKAGDNDTKKSQYLYRTTFKHTRKTEKDYAEAIIKAIHESRSI